MPSTPRRTPGSQSPASRASARRPATAGGARGAAGRTGGTGRAGGTSGAGGADRTGGANREPARNREAGLPRARPTRRPGARRTTASTGADRRFHRRSGGRFTGRAAIVAAVVSVLILSLAYPMQEYLAQRSQIAAAEQERAEQLRRIADKEERKEKWSDSAFVRAQASKRFGLVEPGVIVYHIKEDASVTDQQPGPGQPAGQTSTKAPWYSQLWSSVKAADRPAGTPAD